jgi:hypothetical protein
MRGESGAGGVKITLDKSSAERIAAKPRKIQADKIRERIWLGGLGSLGRYSYLDVSY